MLAKHTHTHDAVVRVVALRGNNSIFKIMSRPERRRHASKIKKKVRVNLQRRLVRDLARNSDTESDIVRCCKLNSMQVRHGFLINATPLSNSTLSFPKWWILDVERCWIYELTARKINVLLHRRVARVKINESN